MSGDAARLAQAADTRWTVGPTVKGRPGYRVLITNGRRARTLYAFTRRGARVRAARHVARLNFQEAT